MSPHRIAMRGWIMLLVAVLAIAACRSSKETSKETSKVTASPSRPPIEEVLQRHTPALLAIEGVVGTYEGRTEDGEPCIKVMVAQDNAQLRARLPESLEGYAVVVRQTGEIAPLDDK